MALGLSHRDVAASLGVSLGAITLAEQRARDAGLDWLTVEQLDDDALELRLYGVAASERRRPLLDPAALRIELILAHADGSYSRFLARLARTDVLVLD